MLYFQVESGLDLGVPPVVLATGSPNRQSQPFTGTRSRQDHPGCHLSTYKSSGPRQHMKILFEKSKLVQRQCIQVETGSAQCYATV